MAVGRVLITVAIAAFGCVAFASGLDRLSEDAPSLERLVPAPFRAQADRSAAVSALARQDSSAALASSRDAVAVDPVDPDATAALGSALMRVGRAADADRTFRIAARFGWRNIETQAYWYAAALQAGDFGVAAERLDALLRVHPRLVDQSDLLKPMESEAAGRKALAAHLALSPPWLDQYLHVGDDTPSDVLDRRLAVLTESGSARVTFGCAKMTTFVRTLVDDGRRGDAQAIWNRHCPSMKVSSLIADPTFAQVVDTGPDSPFAWRVMSSGDLAIEPLSERGNAGGISISNSAPGTRLALVQAVAFQPGLYHLYASEGSAGSASRGKLWLSWTCNGKPTFPDTSEGDLATTGQDIRVTDCDRQQIGLWISGGGNGAKLKSIEVQKIG